MQVATPEGNEHIVSMPKKFRRHVYVRRSSFVVTEPIPEGRKVKGEIVRILQRNQIKYFHQENVWPEAFKSTVYLDNTFSSNPKYRLTDKSDRGCVHGEKYYHLDSGKAYKKTKSDSPVSITEGEQSDEERPYIEPNFNKKAVTRIIFTDEEDSDEEDSECGDGESEEDEEEEEKESSEEIQTGDIVNSKLANNMYDLKIQP